jgi:hypothetical protein
MARSAPRVFISYSQDSFEHARRVMGLAERLRKDPRPVDRRRFASLVVAALAR